jgi:hypothetical protein
MDKTTFDTLTVLPTIPGVAAGDFNSARTQPWSASAAMMPLKAPYVAPVTIVICGGATFDEVALDTCVSIIPEAPVPQWVIEHMVGPVTFSNAFVFTLSHLALDTSSAKFRKSPIPLQPQCLHIN